jgi:hypothetical protein
VPIFVDAFLEGFDRDAVRSHLDAAIARRVADANLNELERDAARTVRVERR